MSVGENIKRYREQRNISGEELGKAIGISRQTIHRYESGKIENIPHEKLEKMAEVLGVRPAQLYGWEEDMSSTGHKFSLPPAHPVPLVSQVASDGRFSGETVVPLYAPSLSDEPSPDDPLLPDLCYRMHDDSMVGARICVGDLVFVRKQSQVANGEIALVCLDGETCLKRIYYYPETEKMVLLSENTAYEPLVYVGKSLSQVTVLGKVISFQSRVR